MKDVTIRVDDETLQAASVRASREGTRLEDVLREALVSYARATDDAASFMSALRATIAHVQVPTAGRSWNRDELREANPCE